MIRTPHDACCFLVMGGLLPAFGTALLFRSATPLVCWLTACALVVITEDRHVS